MTHSSRDIRSGRLALDATFSLARRRGIRHHGRLAPSPRRRACGLLRHDRSRGFRYGVQAVTPHVRGCIEDLTDRDSKIARRPLRTVRGRKILRGTATLDETDTSLRCLLFGLPPADAIAAAATGDTKLGTGHVAVGSGL